MHILGEIESGTSSYFRLFAHIRLMRKRVETSKNTKKNNCARIFSLNAIVIIFIYALLVKSVALITIDIMIYSYFVRVDSMMYYLDVILTTGCY